MLTDHDDFCSKDDYRISLRCEIITKDMTPMCPVDMSGRFTDPVSDFKGQYVKVYSTLSATCTFCLLCILHELE